VQYLSLFGKMADEQSPIDIRNKSYTDAFNSSHRDRKDTLRQRPKQNEDEQTPNYNKWRTVIPPFQSFKKPQAPLSYSMMFDEGNVVPSGRSNRCCCWAQFKRDVFPFDDVADPLSDIRFKGGCCMGYYGSVRLCYRFAVFVLIFNLTVLIGVLFVVEPEALQGGFVDPIIYKDLGTPGQYCKWIFPASHGLFLTAAAIIAFAGKSPSIIGKHEPNPINKEAHADDKGAFVAGPRNLQWFPLILIIIGPILCGVHALLIFVRVKGVVVGTFNMMMICNTALFLWASALSGFVEEAKAYNARDCHFRTSRSVSWIIILTNIAIYLIWGIILFRIVMALKIGIENPHFTHDEFREQFDLEYFNKYHPTNETVDWLKILG